MRSTGIYKKVGRRYIEIGEYDRELMDYVPNGVTMTVKLRGCTSTRHNVDPDILPLLAAGVYCEDAISRAIMDATEIRRNSRGDATTPLTPAQKAAWDHLVEEFGPSAKQLEWPSARECAEAGTKALIVEAEKLLVNESVREAYNHFLLLCKLSCQKPVDNK